MALEEGRFFTGSISDRRHNADGLAEYCKRFLTSGVWELGDNLLVSPAGGMAVSINYGSALVEGYPYRIVDNQMGPFTLAVAIGDEQPRIDRVVIRKDVLAQRVYACIKQGTPAATPTPSPLERTATIYEISLARLSVAAGAVSITADNMTDERTDAEVCGNVFISDTLISQILLLAHPPNSYYWSDDSTSPAIIFGGVWTRVKDRFPLAAGDIYPAGETGGSPTHTLSQSETPTMDVIIAGTRVSWNKTAGGNEVRINLSGSYGSDFTGGYEMYVAGGAQPFSILPPYRAAYCWRRTA